MPRTVVGLLVAAAVVACSGPAVAPPKQPSCDQGNFADVVEDVAPSVVTVRLAQGVGSGVVFKSDVVLTNNHVVTNNTEVSIVYADGSESRAAVVAGDPGTDVAVVRTERKGLTPARFAAGPPRPGCPVLAIGSPLGLQNSVTAGVVSGLHRSIPTSPQGSALVDLIQTDAPISPGNSGGALLDTQGQVVGVNEAYIPPEAGAVSIGFAIPAATVVDVAEQLLAGHAITHAYLGVSVGELTPSIRDRLGVKATRGALVLGVEPGSPAAAAGVRPGDVITRLADAEVRGVDDLLAALRARKPGDQVALVVIRGGDQRELTVTLGIQRSAGQSGR
jgi:serine protease Do